MGISRAGGGIEREWSGKGIGGRLGRDLRWGGKGTGGRKDRKRMGIGRQEEQGERIG